MRCREEDLNRAQHLQKMHEEQLRQKEQELHAREIDLLERELHFMIKQQTPTPIKRKGKNISFTSQFFFCKDSSIVYPTLVVLLFSFQQCGSINNKKS